MQLTFPERSSLVLSTLAEELSGVGTVAYNEYLLRLDVDEHRITLFPDGRAIMKTVIITGMILGPSGVASATEEISDSSPQSFVALTA